MVYFLKAQEEDPELSKMIEALKYGVTIPPSTVPALKKFLQDGLLCHKFTASCVCNIAQTSSANPMAT